MVAAGGGGGGAYASCTGSPGGNGDQDSVAVSTNTYFGQPGKKGEKTSSSNGGNGGTKLSSCALAYKRWYQTTGGGGGGGYYGGGGGGSGSINDFFVCKAGNDGNNGDKLYGGTGAAASYSGKTQATEYSYPGGGGGGGSSYIDETIVKRVSIYDGNTTFPNILGIKEIGNRRNGAIRIIDKLLYIETRGNKSDEYIKSTFITLFVTSN